MKNHPNRRTGITSKQPPGSGRITLYVPVGIAVYCGIVCVLLFLYGLGLRSEQTELRGRIAAARRELADVHQQRIDAESGYRREADEQERRRPEYSGKEAVEQSVTVQAAKARYEELKAREVQQEAAAAQLTADGEALAIRWVPLIAVMLLHALGLFIVRQRIMAILAR